MATDLAKVAKDRGIKYFLISYVDLFGGLRAKLVPAPAIGEMQKAGAGFAGFATWLDMTPADPDLFAVPDPDSLIQLPWKPEIGWLASDLVMNDELVAQAPRNVLKNTLMGADSIGYQMKTGVECEYFLITPDASAISDPADNAPKPCYDQSALMRRFDVISEISDAMLTLGWGCYQNDHEDANGQFEMNWAYDDALITADRHVFFKYMVKSIAEKHGLRATFMPKPFIDLTGSGCHMHTSLWQGEDNVFADPAGELGLSQLGYHFIGGLIHSADAHLRHHQPDGELLQAHQCAAHRLRRHLGAQHGDLYRQQPHPHDPHPRCRALRVPPRRRRGEPYLLPAAVLAAGLDGVQNQRDPGKRLDINMYTDGHKVRGAKRLPLNLLDALRALARSNVLRAALGAPLIDGYLKLKSEEWNSYARHLTQWERDNTLDI